MVGEKKGQVVQKTQILKLSSPKILSQNSVFGDTQKK